MSVCPKIYYPSCKKASDLLHEVCCCWYGKNCSCSQPTTCVCWSREGLLIALEMELGLNIMWTSLLTIAPSWHTKVPPSAPRKKGLIRMEKNGVKRIKFWMTPKDVIKLDHTPQSKLEVPLSFCEKTIQKPPWRYETQSVSPLQRKNTCILSSTQQLQKLPH